MEVSRYVSRLAAAKSSALAVIIAVIFVAACSPESALSDTSCDVDEDCGEGAECVEGYCVELLLDAALQVDIDGLPGDLDADITVDGPDDVQFSLTESTTLDELPPGDYEINARWIGNQVQYAPQPESTQVTIASEQTAQVTIDYELITGGLDVVFAGLPDGIDGVAEVDGPDGSTINVVGDETLEDLVPGTYLVVSETIEDGGGIYEADAVTVDVSSNDIGEALVSYNGIPGSIQVETAGLPEEAMPNIQVLDVEGNVVHQIPENGLVEGVQPGFYTILPDAYEANGTTYLASEADVDVASNETSEVNLQYLVDPGALTVNVEGLPEGVEHSMQLVGPDGSIDVPQSGELVAVEPGDYMLEIDDSIDGDATYEADDQSVTLVSGEVTEIDVNFEVVPAELIIQISGLPDELQGSVDVVGGELDTTVSDEETTLGNLVPGEYVITPNDVQDVAGGVIYVDSPQSVELGSGDSETVEVEYEAVEGGLRVSVDGLEGNSATVHILDDEGEQAIAPMTIDDGSSDIVTDLEPGTYSVVPLTVDVSPKRYEAATISDIEITSGALVEETASYDFLDGELRVEATGLGSLSFDAEVTGPQYSSPHSFTAQGTELLEGLEPGNYTVTFDRVDDGENSYDPNPTLQTVTVYSEGLDTTDDATTTYELVGGQIQVIVGGLEGNTATIEIHDDNGEVADDFEVSDGSSETSANLAPGIYSVVPQDETESPKRFEASEITDIEVVSEDVAEETVNYSYIDGELSISATGLGGLPLQAEVTGPEYSSPESVTGDDTLENLEPGDYTVTFLRVHDSPDYYDPDPEQRDITVYSEGLQTTEEATTEYGLVGGHIEVAVSGLEGNAADVEIQDSNGVEVQTLEDISDGGSLTSDELAPGTYSLVPQNITDFPKIYEADNPPDIEIESGSEELETIAYDFIRNDLTIEANGLSGREFTVEVEGAEYGASSQEFSDIGEIEITDIEPDEYTVTFQEVTDDDNDYTEIYRPDPEVTTPTVASDDAGETESEYTVVTGDLTVEVDVPDEADAVFELVEIGGDPVDTFSDTEEFSLTPGHYEILVDEDDTDEFGNSFDFEGIEEEIVVSSDDELTHNISAPLPTLVTTEQDDGNSGSLREIVDNVVADSVITFADGVENVELEEGSIMIDKPLTIDGEDSDVTISLADGGDEERLFTVNAAGDNSDIVTFQDLSLEGGRSGGHGGAVHISAGDVATTFFGVEFHDNTADDNGGALYAESGAHVVLREVVFDENHAGDAGGAIYGSDIDIDEAHFVDNSALDGGALYINFDSDARADLRRALFESNHADDDGGAAYVEGDAYVENSTFAANNADGDGGALYFGENSQSVIVHATMLENSASSGQAILASSTTTGADIGEIQLGSSYLGNVGSHDNHDDKIVADTSAQSAAVQSLGHNFITQIDEGLLDDYFNDEDSDIVGADASYEGLSDAGGFTQVHPITAGTDGYLDIDASDCRDINGDLMAGDQRGAPRPSGAKCTRGAWEVEATFEDFQGAGFPDSPGSGSFDGAGGITWNYSAVRNAGDYPIDGEGARFESEGANVSTADIDATDIESFSVQYRKAGDEDEVRGIEVLVDDELIAASGGFGDSSGVEDDIYVLEIDDFDPEDAGALQIRNTRDYGVTIDNISWR